MSLKLLKIACGLCLLSTFWSVIRVFDVSIFEWLTALVVPFALLYRPRMEGVPIGSFKLAGAGLAIMTLAGIISSQSSLDAIQHILKVTKLVATFALMLGFSYILANRRIFSVMEVLYLLCISAAVSSFVAILQGQFGLLTGLIPTDEGKALESWIRMTGLAEHPIEAGVVSAYGFLISLGLAIIKRKWRLLLLLIAIDAYSMRFSASLTAVFAFVFSGILLCVFTRKYKLLVTGAALGAGAITALLLFSSGAADLLVMRLSVLYSSQGNYQTVQIREMQLHKALSMIDASTLVVGNGYSSADLPYKMEIHNGLVASVFHFGLLGLISQILMVAFFASRLGGPAPPAMKGILLGAIIIFASAYMTGPAQARPSLWAPLLLLGAFMSVPMLRTNVRASSSYRPSPVDFRPPVRRSP
jgi:hypothetical protein